MPLSLWTVTRNPSDFPGKFVARETVVSPSGELRVDRAAFVADTLERVREMLPEGLHRVPRALNDDPVIVEVWL